MKLLFLIVIVYLVVDTEAYKGYYRKWNHRKPKCEPLDCGPDCKEEPAENGCQKCVCAPKCPEVVCGKGCVIKEEFNGPCPGCDCEVDIGIVAEEEDVPIDPRTKDWIFPEDTKEIGAGGCSELRCPLGCKKEINFNGPCPICNCGAKIPELIKPPIPCLPPKCPPGCQIETEFYGPCPGCKCEEEVIPDLDIKGMCDPVKCQPGCTEKIGASGCPMCECGPVCDPPRCAPGCSLGQFPGEICPSCKCEEVGPPPEIDIDIKGMCDPVKCQPGCIEKIGASGCPMCECGPMCDPVKCQPGCREEIGESGCPICECRPICDPPICTPECPLGQFPGDICPSCKCKEVIPDVVPPAKIDDDEKKDCEIPHCHWRCKLDKSGPCPTCVCKKRRWG